MASANTWKLLMEGDQEMKLLESVLSHLLDGSKFIMARREQLMGWAASEKGLKLPMGSKFQQDCDDVKYAFLSFHEGNTDKCFGLCQSVLKVDPSNLMALLFKAICLEIQTGSADHGSIKSFKASKDIPHSQSQAHVTVARLACCGGPDFQAHGISLMEEATDLDTLPDGGRHYSKFLWGQLCGRFLKTANTDMKMGSMRDGVMKGIEALSQIDENSYYYTGAMITVLEMLRLEQMPGMSGSLYTEELANVAKIQKGSIPQWFEKVSRIGHLSEERQDGSSMAKAGYMLVHNHKQRKYGEQLLRKAHEINPSADYPVYHLLMHMMALWQNDYGLRHPEVKDHRLSEKGEFFRREDEVRALEKFGLLGLFDKLEELCPKKPYIRSLKLKLEYINGKTMDQLASLTKEADLTMWDDYNRALLYDVWGRCQNMEGQTQEAVLTFGKVQKLCPRKGFGGRDWAAFIKRSDRYHYN